MSRNPNLSTQIKNEKKIFSMFPGRFSLRPKRTRTVQLGDGTFSAIDEPPVFIETLGERRNSMTTRAYDPANPADAEVIRLVEEKLELNPWMADDVRYQLRILGEHQANMPWQGYDEQDAEQMKATYLALPSVARKPLAEIMKYELSKTRYDAELDEDIPATDDDKVKVLNELHRLELKEQSAVSTDTVDLD